MLNIGSGGILFEIDDMVGTNEIPESTRFVEVAMDWPFLLRGTCAMKLIIRGRMVRRDAGRLALRTVQHEFRTAGRSKNAD